jgi:hypothetical protein
MVFMQPQRLAVPLFQRPYVWNEENQWEPLWNDLIRVAERVLARPADKHHPHFLGAVVLQQVPKQTGQLQERTIIDGQQRLTTLQLLLHALCVQLRSISATQPAMRIEPLVTNSEPFRTRPEDQFKVWPTNRDRPAFAAVMKNGTDGGEINFPGDRIANAHRYFAAKAHEWLTHDGPNSAQPRAGAIETVVRELLLMVIIDLSVDENAQEIFETLNARGAQLSAADLIKNFIFQRLLESGTNVENAYQQHWKEFETGFWELEINVGRLRYPRSAIFLNHWLIARTGEEVVAREVFNRFKAYADHQSAVPMAALLQQVHAAAGIYRNFINAASPTAGPIERLGLFGYRTGVLESEVIKPLILCLLDPEEPSISNSQLFKVFDVVESWMVRRMLVRATTKAYNQLFADLIKQVKSNRTSAGDVIERYLAGQSTASRYWPDDKELEQELNNLLAYRRLGRGRLRMVLEAAEDHLRGWKDGKQALGEERVARGKLAIEHIMPRKWQPNWPLEVGHSEIDRDRLIHTLGNLTLLTTKLNSKVSNGRWSGSGGKRESLQAHDVLLLNREILKGSETQWTDEMIRVRTENLVQLIIQIWPVPLGHKSDFHTETKPSYLKKVELSDLMNGGFLPAGISLFPRRKKYSNRIATLLADGKVEVDGVSYVSPSDAAKGITGKRTNGWWFFLTDQNTKVSLRDIRRNYIDALAVDAEEDEPDAEEEDDE